MPEGGMGHGEVAQPPLVAIALKSLLGDMRVPGGVPAVIGIPSEGVTVRTLNVPPAPDEEIATIVAGEVEHYRILRSKGSFAYVPLTPPVHGEGSQPISVVIAAAEEQVTRSIGELAGKAEVRLVALEPTEFGQLRAAVAAIGQQQTVFAILIGDIATDLAVFSKGQLWFYRRLDYGAMNLAPDRRPVGSMISAFTDDDLILPEEPAETQKYNESILDGMCAEISRSVDYLRREYKEHAQFAVLHVSIDDPALEDIAPHLSERLGIAVETIAPCGGVSIHPDATEATGPDGFRYTAAFGLAIRDSLAFTASLPRVDLYEVERTAVQTQILRRNLTGSFITSGVAILFGILGYWLYGRQISTLSEQTEHARSHAAALKTQAATATEQHQMRSVQVKALSAEGVPPTAVTDFIAGSLDPGVGIDNLSVSADKTVMITADAVDEAGMLRTVENLQRVPIFQNVMVQTFSRKSDRESGLSFTVVAKTLAASQVRISGESGLGGVQ